MKQIWLVASGSVVLLILLFFLGRTKPHPKDPVKGAPAGASRVSGTSDILEKAKKQLKPEQLAYLTTLENSITRGDLVNQKIVLYEQLAAYWRDSVRAVAPYLWYQGEKAKLENSEKNLNFAAQSYLEELKSDSDPEARTWMADQAKVLFEKVMELNPDNDSAKVGWGSSFIFGASGASSPMEGIMKIREVAERDTTNMYAQFMLGYGAMMTGQFDRAIERLLKVANRQPQNTEAVFLLAEAYERAGKKTEAREWYSKGRSRVSNPELLKAIDDKINSLQQ